MESEKSLIAVFYTHLLTEKRVAQNTFLAYRRDIDQLIAFLANQKVTIETCTKSNLKNFLKWLKRQGIAARTVSRKISAIKLLFSFLAERYGFANRAQGLIFPKLEKTLPIYLSEQEVEKLFVVAGHDEGARGVRNKVMLSLLYASGMRISELLSLTIDEVRFDTGFVQVVGKGGKERSVPLPQSVLTLIRYYLDAVYSQLAPEICTGPARPLFISFYHGQARAMTRQAFWIILKKLLTKASIDKPVSPHSLRHSLATHLLQNGANLRSLQLLLGHESLSTIQIYTHLEKSNVRRIYDKKHPRA